MGTVTATGLATLVAEELDADWAQMRGALAHADDQIYANLLFGMQGTGGSTAIANSFDQMRLEDWSGPFPKAPPPRRRKGMDVGFDGDEPSGRARAAGMDR